MHFRRLHSHGFAHIAAVLLVVVIVGLIGTYTLVRSHAMTPQKKTSAPTSTTRYWIMNTPALNDVVINPTARKAIAADTIYVPSTATSTLARQTSGLHIQATESFTSEAQLATAIQRQTIRSGIKALLYDNENWSLTPAAEQANPLTYYKQAAALAHAHGYLLIATPVSKSDPQIGVQIAPYVDVLDIQAQNNQATSSLYSNRVLPIAQAARQANAKLIILSGLSTNPPAGIPTPQQLVNDTKAVSSVVQGYWLNIPSPGMACPNCYAPQPQIGIQFLAELGAS